MKNQKRILFGLVILLLVAAVAAVPLAHADGFYSVATWNTQGDGSGTILNPRGIAVTSSGTTVYVGSDDGSGTNSGRVDKYTISGSTVTNVARWTAIGANSLDGTEGVATDSTGTMLYIADTSDNEVLKATNLAGTPTLTGTLTGLSSPRGVATSSDGSKLFVANEGASEVRMYTVSGGTFTLFGTLTATNAGLSGPRGVATNSDASFVYIADTVNNRIQKYYVSPSTVSLGGSQTNTMTGSNPSTAKTVTISGLTLTSGGASLGTIRITQSFTLSSSTTVSGSVPTVSGNSPSITFGQLGVSLSTSGSTTTLTYTIPVSTTGAVSGASLGTISTNLTLGAARNNVTPTTPTAAAIMPFIIYWFWTSTAPYGVAVDTSGNVYAASQTGDVITQYDGDGVQIGSVGSTGAGTGQLSGPRGLGLDSSKNLFVADTDNNRAQKFSVDNTVPSAIITSPANSAVLGSSFTVSGTASDNIAVSQVQVKIDSGSFQAATGTTSWTFAASGLANGAHTITARATDSAGNTGDSTPISVTVDTIAPAAPTITTPTAGSTVNASPTFTGSAEASSTDKLYIQFAPSGTQTNSLSPTTSGTAKTSTISGLTVTTNGATSGMITLAQQVVLGGGSATLTLGTPTATGVGAGLTLGTMSAAVTSGAGTATQTLTITIPFTASGGLNSIALGTINTPVTLSASRTVTSATTATAASGNYLVGSGTATAGGAWSIVPTNPLPSGSQTFFATATDAGANVSPQSATRTVAIDSTAPAAPVITAPASPTNDNTPDISGTKEANSSVTLYDTDGVSIIGSTAVTAGTTWTITTSTLSPGAHTLTAKSADAVGNVSPLSNSVSITINNAPVASNTSATTNEDTTSSPITLPATDSDDDTLSYSIVASPSHGTLSGSGNSRTYTPNSNYNGPDSFTFKANDGTADSNTATVSITVSPVNDAPTVNGQSVTTNEDTQKTITLTGADIDGNSLTFAIITGPTHGTLGTITSLGSTSANVTYTPAANYNGPDSFTFKANDGTADSSSATVLITINPVNDTPTANPQSVTTNEDTPKAIVLTGSDVESSVTFSIATNPSHGTLTGFNSATGAVTYNPASNYNGPDSFTFKANDGTVDSSAATVSITIDPVNDAPIASDTSTSTNEDTPVTLTLTAADIDSGSVTFSVVSGPTHGNLGTITPTGSFTAQVQYTPTANYNGPDSFTFKANDGTADSNTATVSITINSINDVPTADNQNVNTNEDTPVDIVLTGSDIEDGTSVTYAVTSGPSHGTLSGTAPNLTYTPDSNYNGSDEFKFKVTDSASAESSEAIVSIAVAAVNDEPVLGTIGPQSINELSELSFTAAATDNDSSDILLYSLSGEPSGASIDGSTGAFSWTPTESQGPGSYTFDVTVSDGNGGTDTESVTVTVNEVNSAPALANPGDQIVPEGSPVSIELSATDSDIPTNVLTFNATGLPSWATINSATGEITGTPNESDDGISTITVAVSDGTATDEQTFDLTVTEVNSAPTASNNSLSTDEDSPVVATLVATDNDLPANTLTFSIVDNPTHGTLSGTAPNLTYTPDSNYNGSDSFTFKANDGQVDSNTATVDITVNSVNDAPTADSQSITTDEDVAVPITLAGSDIEGDSLTFNMASDPSHGTLSGTAPNLTYTPDSNYNGSDSFTFKVNDGTADSNEATIDISIGSVNDAPVADNQNVSTAEDTALPITVTASDVDHDSLTFAVVDNPTHGTLSGTAPNLTYTPNSNYNGPDSFTFKANDGTADSNTATISLSVTAANDTPTADSQSVTTNEDTAVPVTLNGSDVEDGTSLTYTVTSNPSNGVLSGTAPNLTYTPDANYNGSDEFKFKVMDSESLDSTEATVSITVDAVNDSPVATNDNASTSEDTPVTVSVLTNDSDIDGNALSILAVGLPSDGTAVDNGNGTITYTPHPDFNGPDSFTYDISDGNGGSATATVYVTVSAVNDGPVAADDSATTDEDTPALISVLDNDSDNDSDPLLVTFASTPSSGTVTINANNTITYTPNANYNGPDSFTYDISDGNGGTSSATVSITVSPVNDAPVADAQSLTTDEDTGLPVTLTASDIEGNTLSFAIVDNPTHGTLSGTAPNLTYTPDSNYNGSDSFTFKANDGSADSNVATIDIGVGAINDAPVASNASVTTSEDNATGITLAATDSDGDTLSYSIVDSPTHGTLSGTAPNLTYTPDSNYNGPDSFIFKANDGQVDSNTATVDITVTAVNDAPTADSQSVTTSEDTPKAVTLTGSDVEDGTSLTYTVTSNPSNGVLSGTAPNLTYTPDSNYNGSDEFKFKVTDSESLESTEATVSITVGSLNDAPVASDTSATTNEDTPTSPITLPATDTDGDTLTYEIVDGPANGVLSGSGNSRTYTPNSNYNGPDSFTFKANDGTADSNTATVTLSVAPVNDAPIANSQSITTDEDVAVPVTLTGSDIEDGTSVTYTVTSDPSHGTLSGTAPNLTYTPDSNYNGPDEFKFKVADSESLDSSEATVSISVSSVNNAPVAGSQSLATAEDTALPVTLAATDTDGDSLSYSVVGSPANGVLSGTAPNLTYTPDSNYNGPDSFTFKANDGNADSNIATINISVSAVNDAPVVAGQSLTTNADTAKLVTLSGTDVDGNSLTFAVGTGPSHGTLSIISSTGTTTAQVTYSPTGGYSGPDSFTFKANDGTTDSTEATISINVIQTQTFPVAHMTDTTQTYGLALYGPSSPTSTVAHVEFASPTSQLVGKSIDQITLKLRKTGSPTGTAEIGVFNADLTVKKLFGTKNVATITSTYGEYAFTLAGNELYTIASGDRIGIKYTGGSSTNFVAVMLDRDAADPFDGSNSYRQQYNTSWLSYLPDDLYMVLTQTHSSTGVALTVSATPASGLYNTAQSVTLTASASSTIYYTTDGSTPTQSSSVYAGPIAIPSTTTLKFFAKDAGGNLSTISAETYTIDTVAPTVIASPTGGNFGAPQSVSLTASEPATIYYTTDGSTPTASSTVYSGPIAISTNTTLKYFAKDNAGNAGAVNSQAYTFNTVTFPVAHMTDTTQTYGLALYGPSSPTSTVAHVEFVSSTSQLVGKSIDQITLKLRKTGLPTGIAEIAIYNADLTVKKSFGTKDVSTLTSTYADNTFSLSGGELYTIASGDRIGIKYTGGDASNFVAVMLDRDSANPFDDSNSYRQQYNTSWLNYLADDLYMVLTQTHA